MDVEILTTKEFCERNRISLSTYFKLKKMGLGPRTMKNIARDRITLAAEADWRREREEPSDAEQRLRKREAAARVAAAKRAGTIAAQSPKHVSKRGKVAV